MGYSKLEIKSESYYPKEKIAMYLFAVCNVRKSPRTCPLGRDRTKVGRGATALTQRKSPCVRPARADRK
jgi:hypothetical protein